jgi:hypothetical protein
VDGDSGTYVGTVIGQGSGQVRVIDSTGRWAGTVKDAAGANTAEFFGKDGEMRAILRATGKQTIGVFSPTGDLDTIIIERTVPSGPGTTDTSSPSAKPPSSR